MTTDTIKEKLLTKISAAIDAENLEHIERYTMFYDRIINSETQSKMTLHTIGHGDSDPFEFNDKDEEFKN